MLIVPKPIIIVEGADCCGKTTLVEKLKHDIYRTYGACVVTAFGPLPGVTNLAPHYFEAMMPALLGKHPVLFDRSWFSEAPYSMVSLRAPRVTRELVSKLNQLVNISGGGVVHADVDTAVLKSNYKQRGDALSLPAILAARKIYRLLGFGGIKNLVGYNYKRDEFEKLCQTVFDWGYSASHKFYTAEALQVAGVKLFKLGEDATWE